MRGSDAQAGSLFSYVDLEDRVPKNHPLRVIREIADEVLHALGSRFAAAYSRTGRPSIPPERLLRALLLQAFYTIRSERQLMERLNYDLLFRWFVGLGIDDRIWDATVFTKNRDRLLATDAAAGFLSGIVSHPRVRRLMSRDHFSVDGTLIEAWASIKSFQPIDAQGDQRGEERDEDQGPPAGGGRNHDVDFKGRKRSNATHRSTTDADARLMRKGAGKEAKLAFMGHALMENRSGLAVDGRLTRATGDAEPAAALDLAETHLKAGATLGADKGYDVRSLVDDLRERGVTAHVAQNRYRTKTGRRRRSAIDGRTTRHPGYAVSQRARKRIEEIFGWLKTIGGMRKTRFRGRERVEWAYLFALAAYNLTRLPKLFAPSPS